MSRLPIFEFMLLQGYQEPRPEFSDSSPVLASTLPGQEQEEGLVSVSPGSQPVPVDFLSSPSKRSSEVTVQSEDPATRVLQGAWDLSHHLCPE